MNIAIQNKEAKREKIKKMKEKVFLNKYLN